MPQNDQNIKKIRVVSREAIIKYVIDPTSVGLEELIYRY
jgi:hypothetical protein